MTDPVQAELVTLLSRHTPGDGVHATTVPALHLIRASETAQRLPAVYEPGLVLVVQGRKQALLGHELLSDDPLHCLVVSVTMLPLAQIVEASAQRIGCAIELLKRRFAEPVRVEEMARAAAMSPSQFSREYRRLFGAPPKADAAVVRRAVTVTS
jgi:transcriptional regulator GlxA family with amidase domain